MARQSAKVAKEDEQQRLSVEISEGECSSVGQEGMKIRSCLAEGEAHGVSSIVECTPL